MENWLESNKYLNTILEFDGKQYEIKYNANNRRPADAPKILIVSYQPNKDASILTRLSIECIKKFTDIPYELWVIDDHSPVENLGWMNELNDVNLVFIRTEPKERGSYSNGIAMEVGVRLIDQNAKYVVTFHSDTVVCKYGWLQFLLSKLDNKIRASGFRLTKERVPEGVLHVCGYLIDFQLYKKLNLSFMPELPAYDIGDKLIHEFLKNDYGVFAARNTFDEPESVDLIPETLEIYNINSTRAFDDDNNVVYMHLGRGILKTEGKYKNIERTTSDQWIDYINRCLLSEAVFQSIDAAKAVVNETGDFSLRDFFNDHFIENEIAGFKEDSDICFYGNCDLNKKQYDVAIIKDNNLENPEEDLKQIYDHLNDGGKLIFSCPFIFGTEPINNLNVYSYKWLSIKLWEIGFREVSVYFQGTYRSIQFLIDMEKYLERFKKIDKDIFFKEKIKFISNNLKNLVKQEIKAEENNLLNVNSDILTTGFILKAVK